jgi:predicted enzyme related to lactoylglutathione lyase
MSKVIRFDINTRDPEQLASFYRQVFDWQIEERTGPVSFWRITAGPDDEPGVNGGLVNMVEAEPCTWHVVQVPSVDEALDKAVAAGGEVFSTKRAVTGQGWEAYIRDPEGNVFGLFEEDPSVK